MYRLAHCFLSHSAVPSVSVAGHFALCFAHLGAQFAVYLHLHCVCSTVIGNSFILLVILVKLNYACRKD